jgi:uncharacterized protein (DUF433 family)
MYRPFSVFLFDKRQPEPSVKLNAGLNCVMLCCMEEEFLKRITLNPDVCFGKPTIRNMRYPVEMILDLLGAGMSFADILADYPDLEREDLQACLLFAGKLVKVNSIHKVLAA